MSTKKVKQTNNMTCCVYNASAYSRFVPGRGGQNEKCISNENDCQIILNYPNPYGKKIKSNDYYAYYTYKNQNKNIQEVGVKFTTASSIITPVGISNAKMFSFSKNILKREFWVFQFNFFYFQTKLWLFTAKH